MKPAPLRLVEGNRRPPWLSPPVHLERWRRSALRPVLIAAAIAFVAGFALAGVLVSITRGR